MPVRTTSEPGLDPGRLLGGIVVHHKVDLEAFGHCCIDLLEKVEELGRAIPLLAFADRGAGGDVERRTADRTCSSILFRGLDQLGEPTSRLYCALVDRQHLRFQ